MNLAYVSALAALAGSVIGGLISGITTWLSQRSQARAGELIREMSRRDELYADFIVAASKAYGEALVSNQPQVQGLVALYAMISRMRVMSSPRIVVNAEKIMSTTIETYFAPNITIPRSPRIDKEWRADGSAEGLQRGRARGAAGVRLAIMPPTST